MRIETFLLSNVKLAENKQFLVFWLNKIYARIMSEQIPEEINQRQTKMIHLAPNEELTKTILPDFIAPSVKEIDFKLLHSYFGIRFALIDVDKTLTAVAGNKIIDPGVIQYLLGLQKEAILDGIYLATGSGKNLSFVEKALNAKVFRSKLGMKKPDPEYFKEIIETIGCKPSEAVMIGDRLTHDIKGAKTAGLRTVLVDPIAKGWIKGWIPTDFLGTYWREKNAQKALRRKLESKK